MQGSVTETTAQHARSDGRPVVVSASCTFTFTGTDNQSGAPVTASSAVNLAPAARTLTVGGHKPAAAAGAAATGGATDAATTTADTAGGIATTTAEPAKAATETRPTTSGAARRAPAVGAARTTHPTRPPTTGPLGP